MYNMIGGKTNIECLKLYTSTATTIFAKIYYTYYYIYLYFEKLKKKMP